MPALEPEDNSGRTDPDHPRDTREVAALTEAPLAQFKQALLDTLSEGDLALHLDLVHELCAETGADPALVAAAAARLARRAQSADVLERIAGFTLDSVGKLDQRAYVPRPSAPRRGGPRRGGPGRSSDRFDPDRGGYDREGSERGFAGHNHPDGGYPERNEFERGNRRDQKPVEAGMTRLFLSVGRMDGVRPGDLVGAIAGESGIEGSSIGAIDIYSRYSFVEVPERQSERVIHAISGATVRGRQVTVRPALPPGERPSRPVHLEGSFEGAAERGGERQRAEFDRYDE